MPSGVERFGSLDDGSEYDVLEITVSPSSSLPDMRVMLRIEVEDTPALFSAEMFRLVDGSLPQTWATELGDGAHLTLGPKRWQDWRGQYSFWEDFFSGVPDVEKPAREAFEAERPSPSTRA
ncbi:MAG: hypothetical protein ABL966_10245 [Acidimicrobiales bacterium]